MSLVPGNFVIPELLERDGFKLRPLTIHDVDKDYDAVMSSIEYLQGVFGKRSTWPSPNLTKEQDLIDLGWHQKEFQRRTSFAYTVVKQDESECIGCVYIFPSEEPAYEAEVYMWVRKSAYDKGLDPVLERAVKDWIKSSWPFKKVDYPGREKAPATSTA